MQGESRGHQKFCAKLVKRYYGPFQIVSRINKASYRLKLHEHWHIHNVFHVSLSHLSVEPIQEDPPKFDEQQEILQHEVILNHEENFLQSGKVLHRYLIKFHNYPQEDAKWM